MTGLADKPFGGISVLLVGDTKQLPPVKDTILWSNLLHCSNDASRGGLILFKLFTNVITLNTIVRQDGDSQKQFREILLRLRVGMSLNDDYNILSTRINNCINDAEKSRFKNALYLMHSNSEVALYNMQINISIKKLKSFMLI